MEGSGATVKIWLVWQCRLCGTCNSDAAGGGRRGSGRSAAIHGLRWKLLLKQESRRLIESLVDDLDRHCSAAMNHHGMSPGTTNLEPSTTCLAWIETLRR